MKAIVFEKYGDAEVLQLKNVKNPMPNPHEILIKTKSASINTSDAIGRSGNPIIARFGNGLWKPKQRILGGGIAGVIEAVGSKVTLFKPGERVIAVTSIDGGGYAEYKTMDENEAIITIPKGLSFEEAASIPYGALTTLPFLRDHGKIKPTDSVLIIGASGAIGTCAIQIAKHYGAEVTGVCSGANADLVKSLGADYVIDHETTSLSAIKNRYDIIFDTVGKSNYRICKNLLNRHGKYLLTIPTLAIMCEMLLSKFISGKKAIFLATALRPVKLKKSDLQFVSSLIKIGKLKAVVDKTYLMTTIIEAHQYIETGKKRGNLVLNIA